MSLAQLSLSLFSINVTTNLAKQSWQSREFDRDKYHTLVRTIWVVSFWVMAFQIMSSPGFVYLCIVVATWSEVNQLFGSKYLF